MLYRHVVVKLVHDWATDGRAIMKTLIDALNTMMADVATAYASKGVIHARLTGTLTSADHRQDWMNELHPTESGFDRLTQALHAKL